jgi:glutaredoxin 3
MFKIYSRPNCTYCVSAKKLLESKGLAYVELEVGRDVTTEMLLEVVPGARTVPQIFQDEQYVGGYNDLVERLKNNDPTRYLAE